MVKTRNAFAELAHDEGLGNPERISDQALDHLRSRVQTMRTILDKPADNAELAKERIGEAFRATSLHYKAHIACGLATVQWENNHTFEPVKEVNWLSESWRKKNLGYYPFYGRGYAHITWERNYDLYAGVMGLDLVDDPELALRHDVSLFVLARGMKSGDFTGRRLEEYITRNKMKFVNARRVINGENKAHEIAALAEEYMDAL